MITRNKLPFTCHSFTSSKVVIYEMDTIHWRDALGNLGSLLTLCFAYSNGL